jgi:starch synthase
MSEILTILFLAAEATPFVKVGGLADVAGTLPIVLRGLTKRQTGGVRLDVRLVLPLHRAIQANLATMRPIAQFSIQRNGGKIRAQAFETNLDGLPIYFIDGLPISQAEQIYSINPEQDREKYTFFSLAALELACALNLKVDVIHANDWHTALSLYEIRTRRRDSFFEKTAGLITIHNLPYMGGNGGEILSKYGLKELEDEDLPFWARKQALPMGLWAADAIVPVSETYSLEILTPDFGCGLQDYLHKRTNDITGILNGLDLSQWMPASDECLASKFDEDTLDAREKNKISLMRKIDLDFNSQEPLIGMVTRVDYQKGIDFSIQALRSMMDLHWKFVLLGSGDPNLENELMCLQGEQPDRVRVILRYDAEMSRLIYAGADIFLMPSRYEPCGLSQMIAMRYGCVPVVHGTGGLKDTVQEGKTGFVFEKTNVDEMVEALRRALKLFATPLMWRSFQKSGMKQDFSWTRSARKYSMLYQSIVQKYVPGGEE